MPETLLCSPRYHFLVVTTRKIVKWYQSFFKNQFILSKKHLNVFEIKYMGSWEIVNQGPDVGQWNDIFFNTKCLVITIWNITIQDYQICNWKCNRSTQSILNLVLIYLWVAHGSVLRIWHRRRALSSVYSTGALSLSSTKAWVENSCSRVLHKARASWFS